MKSTRSMNEILRKNEFGKNITEININYLPCANENQVLV